MKLVQEYHDLFHLLQMRSKLVSGTARAINTFDAMRVSPESAGYVYIDASAMRNVENGLARFSIKNVLELSPEVILE